MAKQVSNWKIENLDKKTEKKLLKSNKKDDVLAKMTEHDRIKLLNAKNMHNFYNFQIKQQFA